MNPKTFALLALCGMPFVGSQGTIKIDSVESTMAYEPHGVSIRGTNLDLIQKAQLNGVQVPILLNTGTLIVLAPKPQDPGFAKLLLFHSQGSVDSPIEFLPSLQASRQGDVLRVILNAGEPGPYWLYYSFDLLATPYVQPWIHYHGMLDMTTRYSGLLAKGVSDGASLALSFRIPPGLGLAGAFHIQSLCLYPTPEESEWSFSNLFTLP